MKDNGDHSVRCLPLSQFGYKSFCFINTAVLQVDIVLGQAGHVGQGR